MGSREASGIATVSLTGVGAGVSCLLALKSCGGENEADHLSLNRCLR